MLFKKKGAKSQIINIRTEERDVTIDHTDIKRIIRWFSEHCCASAFDNLDEIGEVLIKHNLPKLTKEEMETPNQIK